MNKPREDMFLDSTSEVLTNAMAYHHGEKKITGLRPYLQGLGKKFYIEDIEHLYKPGEPQEELSKSRKEKNVPHPSVRGYGALYGRKDILDKWFLGLSGADPEGEGSLEVSLTSSAIICLSGFDRVTLGVLAERIQTELLQRTNPHYKLTFANVDLDERFARQVQNNYPLLIPSDVSRHTATFSQILTAPIPVADCSATLEYIDMATRSIERFRDRLSFDRDNRSEVLVAKNFLILPREEPKKVAESPAQG